MAPLTLYFPSNKKRFHQKICFFIMSNNLLYLDVGILINKTINIKLPVHASFLIHCRDHIHHVRNLYPDQRNPEKKANWTGWFRYLMSKFDAKSIKMNFDRFVTSGILWITLGGDIEPAGVGLQSKCLRKWSPSLLSSHLMILIAESTMWDCKTNAWRKQRQYEHDIKRLIAVKFLTDRKLPWRSSGWVGRCATDRWSEDGALFLPTTGLQLQYDPGPRLSCVPPT